MQMVILDQSQEGETIPKDVWGAVERIKGDRGVFLRAKIIVCTPPGICAWPSPVGNFGLQKYRDSGGKFKIQTLTAIFGWKMASYQNISLLT